MNLICEKCGFRYRIIYRVLCDLRKKNIDPKKCCPYCGFLPLPPF